MSAGRELKGSVNMKVVNPLNRIPDTEETMVMACACICDSGSATKKVTGSSNYSHCGCQCKEGNLANNKGNNVWANSEA